MTNTQADVATNLRRIEDMATRLAARAVDRARRTHGQDIPGGEALVSLAGVGSRLTWERRVELAEAADDYGLADSEDPDQMWPALQVLWFWSEDYRVQLGMDYDDPRWRPSLASEASFLRNKDVADWIWDNEIHWDDYAADVDRAKTKLEGILLEGFRTLRGVPCMYDECKGKRLVKKLKPMYHDEVIDGEKVRVRSVDRNGNGLWDFEDWHCPRCHRTWTDEKYAAMVTAAHEQTKVEEVHNYEGHIEEWCAIDYAARKVDRPAKTIQTWVNRHELATLCMIAGRRLPFVSLEDVRELANTKARRTRAERDEAV